MDPRRNPFAPGAGAPPPELAGRQLLLTQASTAIYRIRHQLHAKSILMLGLRGVGKTVLLDRIRDDAEADGVQTARVEAPEQRSLPALLAPELRLALIRLSRNELAKDLALRAMRGLAGFVKSLKVKFADLEVEMDAAAEPGLADAGDLERDLQDLMQSIGEAAQKAGTALVLLVDELQYVKEAELASLITALHRMSQRSLPVTLIGAGLPQLRGATGKAKSYAERLFDFEQIEALDEAAAGTAILEPARVRGVDVTPEALALIYQRTRGYPYFLQEWGKHSWDAAPQSPIDRQDVENASLTAIADLDNSFFRVRFDRVTPQERVYLRAMAELGEGPHSSGDVAAVLGRKVTSLGPVRNRLIAKGMIWSPNHGQTSFTVPLFDQFMRRMMPGAKWKT